jgi:hypothetical protein
MESSMEIPRKTKNRITIWPNDFFFLFIYAYNVWVISLPFSLPPPFPPAPSLTYSNPSLPGRNYSALISNLFEERV